MMNCVEDDMGHKQDRPAGDFISCGLFFTI